MRVPRDFSEPVEYNSGMIDTRFTSKLRNRVVITLRQVMDGSRPILYVVHDEEDGLQFLTDGDVAENDVALVALNEIVDLDDSVLAVVDIRPGYIASRFSVDDEWVVEPFPDDEAPL